MTDFTEQVLAREVLNSAVDHGRIHVQYDMEQGVFTAGIVTDLLTRAANSGHPHMSEHIYELVGQLQPGDIAQTPAAFTADEQTLMDTILTQHVYTGEHGLDGAGELVQSAEYVGFWSEGQLVKLQAQTLHVGPPTVVDAINMLVDDLAAGNQIVGICLE